MWSVNLLTQYYFAAGFALLTQIAGGAEGRADFVGAMRRDNF